MIDFRSVLLDNEWSLICLGGSRGSWYPSGSGNCHPRGRRAASGERSPYSRAVFFINARLIILFALLSLGKIRDCTHGLPLFTVNKSVNQLQLVSTARAT